MKIITEYPVIMVSPSGREVISNAHGGHGGGGHGGGMGRHYSGGIRPVFIGGYYWNGAYWVDVDGKCYTKNWLGQLIPVSCGLVPNVALGL